MAKRSNSTSDTAAVEGKSPSRLSDDELLLKVRELGPWEMGIQLNDRINTAQEERRSDSYEKSGDANVSPMGLKEQFFSRLDSIYPGGIANKSLLDCACNAGGYCFWARERNVKSAVGFDVHDRWIRQARFVKSHRMVAPTDRIQLRVCDLNDVPQLNLSPSEITIFNQLFHYLPDPVAGLKIAAELTTEVLFITTTTSWGLPDGMLKHWGRSEGYVHDDPSRERSLRWYPTGPGVIADILRWAGFIEQKLMFFVQEENFADMGRLEIIASKIPGLLSKIGGKSI
ncbi:MAG: methyltransferase domain-containing protein [Pirellulaceae bacterium]